MSIPFPDLFLPGYNQFPQDRSSKGGGVARFTKKYLQPSVRLAKFIPRQFDLLDLNLKLSSSCSFSVAGCYRPPSAPAWTLPAFSRAVAPFIRSEFVLLGDLNGDELKPADKVLQQFDSLNFHQIISLPNLYDPKNIEKAPLIDFIFHKFPHIYHSFIFCNDMSDRCFIACVRTKSSIEQNVRISYKRILQTLTLKPSFAWFVTGCMV